MKDLDKKPPFPFEQAGRELRSEEVRPRIDEYRRATAHSDQPINAEAFSKEVLMKMLGNDDCQGIRIYYGRKKGKPSLLLVGIDKKGNDIQRVPGGLKDMPGDSGTGVYSDGCPCPQLCSE